MNSMLTCVFQFGQDIQSKVSPLFIPLNKRLRIDHDRSLKQIKRIKIQLNLPQATTQNAKT